MAIIMLLHYLQNGGIVNVSNSVIMHGPIVW